MEAVDPLPDGALVVDFADRGPGTVAEADALLGELRMRLRPGVTVVLVLLALDRAVPRMIWRDYFVDTLLPPLLDTRALLVLVTETGAPPTADQDVSVEDRLRLLRAERRSPERLLDHLDAVAHALAPDEHLRQARRAYALDPSGARRQLGDAAERVGWTGDALALTDDPQLAVTRLRRYLAAPEPSHLGFELPALDLEAALEAFDPATPWWRHERAELASLRGDHAGALEFATGVPDTVEVHRLRARSSLALGRTADAITAYRAAGPDPDDLAALSRLVEPEEAVELAAHAVVLGERHWLELGAALTRRGDRLVGLRVAANGADEAALVAELGVTPEEAREAREWALRPHWNRLEFVAAATGVDRAATALFVENGANSAPSAPAGVVSRYRTS